MGKKYYINKNMRKELLSGIVALSLSSCSMLDFKSIEPKNAIKTAAVTTVAYVAAGPLPALAVAATAITVDEVLPDDEPSITEIESGNKEQMTAFIIANLTDAILYGVMGLLAFLFVIGPWAADRRAKRKMKEYYRGKKYDEMKAELRVRANLGEKNDS